AKGGASDLVQETFLEAQRDFAGFHGGSAEELRAWLRQLLRNNLATFGRRYRDTGKRQISHEVALDPDTPSGGPRAGARPAATPSHSGHARAHDQADALARALERLPEDYRLVLRLRYQEGQPFEEIARRMQRSSAAARKLWFRAIERLQQEL